MLFTIHGPFEIEKSKNGLINSASDAKRRFWANVENEIHGLSEACGCYLFAVKAAHGIKPWYIGLTSKRSFAKECVGAHQLKIYDNVVAGKKGTPLLYLLAKRTKSGKFRKPSKNFQTSVGFLETLLIGAGIEKNRHLQNVSKTRYLREMIVPGLLNSPPGPRTTPEKSFALALLKD